MIEQINCVATNIKTLQSVNDPAPGQEYKNGR